MVQRKYISATYRLFMTDPHRASLVAQTLKVCLQCRRLRFNPWVRKILWRRTWLPMPVFLPGEFCGQKNLVDYSLGGRKESNTAEPLTLLLIFILFT